nr:response regulator transcription factor [uncultured Carboxylicivirga sp.]
MIRILLVDDHAIVREGIKLIVNKIKDFIIVGEYSNGLVWINNFNAVKSDIVLCDIDMPQMDGIQATKQALAMDSDLKIMILSMHMESDYYYDALLAGVKGFILKQSSSTDLEKGIRRVFSGQTFFSEELLYKAVIENEADRKKNNKIELNEDDLILLTNICKGYSNKQLADELCVSIKTIEKNKSKLMRKTDTVNNAGLIVWAVKSKIVKL